MLKNVCDLSDTFDGEREGTANKTTLERVPNLYRQSMTAPTQETSFLLFVIKMLGNYDELGISKQQNFTMWLNRVQCMCGILWLHV